MLLHRLLSKFIKIYAKRYKIQNKVLLYLNTYNHTYICVTIYCNEQEMKFIFIKLNFKTQYLVPG